ncbi:hypothetical protein GCM10027051_34990 [Niabella terrae]
MQRTKIRIHHNFKLILVSLIISLISGLMALSLKNITEILEHRISAFAGTHHSWLFIVLPTIGITTIYFLRKYLFRNRKNKGITEIYKTLDLRKDHLPIFKLPSHYINGFLTVIFGGSTGIEVSTVVATATIGNAAYKKDFSAKMYKRELVCAGVASGIAVLFSSPIAGWLFAMEVIARKFSRSLAVACSASVLVAWGIILLFENERILPFAAQEWQWAALPFVILLSFLGAFLSVYFTLLVINIKNFFSGIHNNFIRVNLGALIVGGLLLFWPQLYGDSYHGLTEILRESMTPDPVAMGLLLLLALLKPIAASLTLGSGGDGGVFAPSIVAGAFLGLLFAGICNRYFGTELVLINFALVGAAATLSPSIYAPFTTLFLVCNLVPNGFVIFIPVLAASLISKKFSELLLPYNVYTYGSNLSRPAADE